MITNKAIPGDSFTSVEQFVQCIDQFVAAHIVNCQSFKWNATDDSILEKGIDFAKRISGKKG